MAITRYRLKISRVPVRVGLAQQNPRHFRNTMTETNGIHKVIQDLERAEIMGISWDKDYPNPFAKGNLFFKAFERGRKLKPAK